MLFFMGDVNAKLQGTFLICEIVMGKHSCGVRKKKVRIVLTSAEITVMYRYEGDHQAKLCRQIQDVQAFVEVLSTVAMHYL